MSAMGKIDRNDLRGTQRAEYFLQENIKVWVDAQNFQTTLFIMDFSPFGIGAVTELREEEILLENQQAVRLSIVRKGKKISFDAIVANIRRVTVQGREWTRVGFMATVREGFNATGSQDEERRKSTRYEVFDDFGISAYTEDNPLYLGQKTLFRVKEISFGGLSLETSARNKFITLNCSLNLRILIPGYGVFRENVTVRSIRNSEDGSSYLVGCEYDKPGRKYLKAIADFSLSFASGSSFKSLRKDNFPITFNSAAVTIKTDPSPPEFEQILNLRLKSYQSQGRLLDMNDAKDQTDRLDEYSRQIYAKIGDRVVGAIRIIFNNGDRNLSEYQPIVNLPDWIWESGFVEASKACTDPDFRGGVVLLKIFGEVFRIALQNKTPYVVMVCLDSLLHLYTPIGCRHTGLYLEHPMLKERMNVLYFDVPNAIKCGKGVSFLYWCFAGLPILKELVTNKQIEVSSWVRAKICLGSFVRFWVVPVLEIRRNLRQDKRVKLGPGATRTDSQA